MTRVLVAAVVLLAALAAGDALRGGDRETRPALPASAPAPESRTVTRSTLVPSQATALRPAGSFLASHVVRGASEILSAADVATAFPSPIEGPTEILHLGVALAARRRRQGQRRPHKMPLAHGDSSVTSRVNRCFAEV